MSGPYDEMRALHLLAAAALTVAEAGAMPFGLRAPAQPGNALRHALEAVALELRDEILEWNLGYDVTGALIDGVVARVDGAVGPSGRWSLDLARRLVAELRTAVAALG